MEVSSFRQLMRAEGTARYRDLMWRRTRDPYIIWLSEVMLQQTQVAARRGARLPALARALPERSRRWPRRRRRTCSRPVAGHGVQPPRARPARARRARSIEQHRRRVSVRDGTMRSRPVARHRARNGAGHSRPFAFDLPGVYLETNVRTVSSCITSFPMCPASRTASSCRLSRRRAPRRPRGRMAAASAPDSAGAPRAPGAAHDVAPVATPLRRRRYPARRGTTPCSITARRLKKARSPTRRAAPQRSRAPDAVSRARGGRSALRWCASCSMRRRRVKPIWAPAAVHMALNTVERAAGRPAVDEALVASILCDLEREGFCARSCHAGDGACDEDRWAIA